MDKLMDAFKQSTRLQFAVLVILFQIAYAFGVIDNAKDNRKQAISVVKNKIVSDADVLPFDTLQAVNDKAPDALLSYIAQLNNQLQEQSASIAIESLTLTSTPPNESLVSSDNTLVYPLKQYEMTIGFITFNTLPTPFIRYFSIWVFLSAVIMTYFISSFYRKEEKIEEGEDISVEIEAPSVWLQIDLKEKKLRNTVNNSEVYLANKPLCFYCALIDYCIEQPGEFLNPNKELPDEFLLLTNKYFTRLMDLGHTIRKRPNFSNNVEKTLSEIRAALDEIFHNDIDKKAIFSPPKAIGEGSRSKAHNVSLQSLEANKVVFVGK